MKIFSPKNHDILINGQRILFSYWRTFIVSLALFIFIVLLMFVGILFLVFLFAFIENIVIQTISIVLFLAFVLLPMTILMIGGVMVSKAHREKKDRWDWFKWFRTDLPGIVRWSLVFITGYLFLSLVLSGVLFFLSISPFYLTELLGAWGGWVGIILTVVALFIGFVGFLRLFISLVTVPVGKFIEQNSWRQIIGNELKTFWRGLADYWLWALAVIVIASLGGSIDEIVNEFELHRNFKLLSIPIVALAYWLYLAGFLTVAENKN